MGCLKVWGEDPILTTASWVYVFDMTPYNATVATFNTHESAESAIKELEKSGFDMKKLSIIGRDYHTDEKVVGYYNTGDRMRYWGSQGAFWGWIWGLLFGSALVVVPGIGPLMLAGPVVLWIFGAIESAVVVGGLSALGAGLYSIGIPNDSVLQYETAIKSGKFIVMAHGTEEEAMAAHEVLVRNKPVSWSQHTLSIKPS